MMLATPRRPCGWSARMPTARGTWASIATSTPRTQLRAPTYCWHCLLNSSFTGQAGVVSSSLKATFPLLASTLKSFTNWQATMLAPKSGSITFSKASSTCASSCSVPASCNHSVSARLYCDRSSLVPPALQNAQLHLDCTVRFAPAGLAWLSCSAPGTQWQGARRCRPEGCRLQSCGEVTVPLTPRGAGRAKIRSLQVGVSSIRAPLNTWCARISRSLPGVYVCTKYERCIPQTPTLTTESFLATHQLTRVCIGGR